MTGDTLPAPLHGTALTLLSSLMADVGVATERCTHTVREHLGPIRCVAMSSAPALVALGGNGVLIVACTDWQPMCRLAHPRAVSSVSLDAAGRVLATACDDTLARVFDVQSGILVATFEHAARVSSVFLSADGRSLATGCSDGTAHVFDLDARVRMRSYAAACAERLHSVFLSVDTTLLLTESDSRANLWSAADGQRRSTFPARGAVVRAHLPVFYGLTASTTSGSDVLLWNAFSGECLRKLEHPGPVHCAFLGDDGRQLLSACEDGKVRRWRTESARCEQVLEGHADAVRGVLLSPSNDDAVSVGDDETARVWDLRSGRCTRVVRDEATAVIAVLPSADGGTLWVAGYDEDIAAYDLRSGRCARRLRGHSAWIAALGLSRDGRLLATGSHDGTAKVWSVADGRCVRTFASGVTYAVALLAEGRVLLTGSRDGALRLWDVSSGQPLARFGSPTVAIRSAAVAADESFAVTGDEEGVVRWWDLATSLCSREVVAHRAVVHDLALSADGRFLFSGSRDGGAKRWDAATGRCSSGIDCDANGIRPVCATADGARLYTGGYDGAVAAWDADSGECVARVAQAHRGLVRSLRLSTDGRLLVSGGKDGTVQFWDAGSLELRATLRNLRAGFLWTTPPDANAPSGWFWTDREDWLDVRAAAADEPLPVADPRRRAYLEVYNSRERTLARLASAAGAHDSRLTELVTIQRRLRECDVSRQIEHRPPLESPR